MRIDEWFDPYNMEHLKAWRVLQVTGSWPEGFVNPEDFVVPDKLERAGLWEVMIDCKIAKAFVEEKLNGKEQNKIDEFKELCKDEDRTNGETYVFDAEINPRFNPPREVVHMESLGGIKIELRGDGTWDLWK